MDTLNIELNFTDVSAAGGLGTLPAGLHDGIIVEFKHFPDTDRLYVYMLTQGIRHRESFGLANPNSMPFLKAFLLSAGVPEGKLGGKGKIPFHKLNGRKAHFQYTPADTDSNGKRVEGSYARYVFYSEAQWTQMAAYANATSADVVVEEPAVAAAPAVEAKPKRKPAAKPTAEPEAASEGDDFDFLLDDD